MIKKGEDIMHLSMSCPPYPTVTRGGKIGALVGLLIQRWSPRVGLNVYREKVVITHAQTLSCLLMVKNS